MRAAYVDKGQKLRRCRHASVLFWLFNRSTNFPNLLLWRIQEGANLSFDTFSKNLCELRWKQFGPEKHMGHKIRKYYAILLLQF